ncbi:MAG: MetQ/NlpA family ABC transporter substrate-binding protein [Dehalococcoidia bacterium]|nr:MetQ/NlpA family ABC transporter substrate-binding protein [Dehalococcoidia bacterium]
MRLAVGKLVWGTGLAMVVAAMAMAMACSGATSPASGGPGGSENTTFKIGTLPIYDVLPWAVGNQEGIFEKAGVKVELVPFASAAEIDAALLAGAIDAGQRDIIAALNMNKDTEQAKIVRTALSIAATGQPVFGMVALSNSNISSVADLRGRDIAIARNTIIDYLTDKMLLAGGVNPKDVNKVNVPQIPMRLSLLQNGQVKAATLAEPVLTQALGNGARLIVDDSVSKVGQSIVLVSTRAIKEKPTTIKETLAAYEQAVDRVNAGPEKYRALLVEVAKVPDDVKDKIKLPKYPKALVSSKADIEAVNKWMMEQDMISSMLPYEKVVDASFLPK